MQCNSFTQCCATHGLNDSIAINYSNKPTEFMESTENSNNQPNRRDYQFKVIFFFCIILINKFNLYLFITFF